ncbi:hypothetical protein T439DRAFT_320881 [Meredithblackwellia eburnea MCA 4105]
MKHTASEIEAILHKESKHRKKRRKEEARSRRDDSMTPPRAASSSKDMFAHEDDDFDESAVPPGQAFKREDWVEKLQDAAASDLGSQAYYEDHVFTRDHAAAFSYGGAAGIAMGLGGGGGGSGMDIVDEEEYAEHIRAGMWRRKHKDEAERIEAIQKAKREKEEAERIETEKREKKEREKIKKLEKEAKKRTKEEEKAARERYELLWKKLSGPQQSSKSATAPSSSTPHGVPSTSSTPSQEKGEGGDGSSASQFLPLRFTDFPWPLYPTVPFPPLSWPKPSDITATSLSNFLLSHVEPTAKKGALRSAVLAYHPDRFDRLVGRIPEDKTDTRERVQELGLRVSQVLNDLMKAAAG